MTKEELEKEAEELYEDWFAHKLGAISIIGVICKMAEPREKRIAELEKKNTALRQDWEIMKNTISEYNDFCDKYISLEKENLELDQERSRAIFKRGGEMLEKFYEICKFIVCLCGTVIVVLMTLSMIAVLLK